jgi:hypothetical protein
MKPAVGTLFLGVLVFAGCRTAHEVAADSYHGATAQTTTAITTTKSPNARPEERTTDRSTTATRPPQSTPPTNPAQEETAQPKPSAPPQVASSQSEFPTAKPVEGKPGYVYSPSDPGKYVDVSGYARGSKVKDPYSGKIFLVP